MLRVIVSALILAVAAGLSSAAEKQPNIVLVFIDDMGYGDLSCYGNPDIETPHIDRLAKEGIRFTQFYVASPICSPSRVGLTTGQYPSRHRINSYLNSRKRNAERGMANFLDPKAPAIARAFHDAGYKTAHFGKWHMGGGRDVGDAPLPKAYGFDESLVSFEGLGDRLLIKNDRLSEQSAMLRRGSAVWVEKHQQTGMYVDRSIDFIRRNRDKSFYLHLWLNDVHDPYRPTKEQMAKFSEFASNPAVQAYYAVVDAMDRQIGRLADAIDKMGLGEKTLIVVCSDNGPTAWPHYDRDGHDAPGYTGGLRGRKWSLYEGGIREPLIVRWKGRIPAGKTDETSVVSAVDFFPTFCALAGVKAPEVEFDGVDQSRAFLGTPVARTRPIFWEYGRDESYLRPSHPLDRSPNLAVRDGQWKLLMNTDGSRMELYDLKENEREYWNVAGLHPEVAARLKEELLKWKNTLPGYGDDEDLKLGPEKVVKLTAGKSMDSTQFPNVAEAEIGIDATIHTNGQDGVIFAHGGAAAGYVLCVRNGRPELTLRVRNQPTTIAGEDPLPKDKDVRLAARIAADRTMTLKVDDKEVATGKAAALLNVHPLDPADVGLDTRGTVGLYQGNFRFSGTIKDVSVTVRKVKLAAATGQMVTRWAGDVDSHAPLPEYPRPQLVRDKWLSLNGYWQYAIRPKDAPRPSNWDGRIVVPFCAESILSEVERRVGEANRLWYRRTFAVPAGWNGERVRLNFGAVDWETRVWLNGEELTTEPHRGGYDSFSFFIDGTKLKKDGPQELVVSVWDPTNAGAQPRGKQTNEPKGIWYTPVTGIWQTVWMEPVPQRGIEQLTISPDAEAGTVSLSIEAGGTGKNSDAVPIAVQIFDRDRVVAEGQGTTDGGRAEFELKIPNIKHWSPESPFLYDVTVKVNEAGGETVRSYFGMRTIAVRKDEAGVDRMFLNGKPVFQLGPLDQGWWPDGLYTAPTDEALRYDLEVTKQLGFNMVRKHVKVEPARWYYWADRLGLLVWQDMPSAMEGGGRGPQHVMKGQPDLEFPASDDEQFRTELSELVREHGQHPSIVVWVPFNEGWGQHQTNEILKWVRELDPTRLVDGPSGWMDREYGDLLDMHRYPGPDMPEVTDGRAAVLGEFGGLGWPVPGQTWITRNNWGYRNYASRGELNDAYAALLEQVPALIDKGLSAAVYTQTTDVEVEVNGLMSYDRSYLKYDIERLRSLHAPLTGWSPEK